nr:MAG TPA_asm: hypothetical protein [Caudoviricetes sp.]
MLSYFQKEKYQVLPAHFLAVVFLRVSLLLHLYCVFLPVLLHNQKI